MKGCSMTKLTQVQAKDLDLIAQVMSGHTTKAGRLAFDQLMEDAAAAAKKPQ